jgi:hypothetical protein
MLVEETHNRLDHFVSGQQRIVIVICALDHHQFLGIPRRVEQAAALIDRDDPIAIAGNDEQRRIDGTDPIERGITIAQQQAHRQERVMMLAHVAQ